MDILQPIKVTNSAGDVIEVCDYDTLLSYDADVYLIFGMRSFGKSYGLYKYCLQNWLLDGSQFAIMRMIDDDIRPGNLRKMFAGIATWFYEETNCEKKLDIYQSSIIAKSVDGKEIKRETVGFPLSLSGWMKYKGNNYDNVTTVIFEEFIEKKIKLSSDDTREGYINNLSTIIRHRSNVKVFCLANTVRKKSPIFDYYQIDMKRLVKGKPALFQEKNGLKIVAYWTPDITEQGQATRHYTVTDNSTARMITGGQWENGEYPTLFNGFSGRDLLQTTKYKHSTIIEFTDLSVYCAISCYPNFPAVFYKSRKYGHKPDIQTTVLSLYIQYRSFFSLIQNSVILGNVVDSENCAEYIDVFKNVELFK